MVMAALFNSISCCLDSAVIDETAAGSPQQCSTQRANYAGTAWLKIVILLSSVLGVHGVGKVDCISIVSRIVRAFWIDYIGSTRFKGK